MRMEGIGMRVVVVEDEIRIREGIQGLLEMMGHTFVGAAENGKEGLELIQKLCPDLVIADIRMPEMDGLEMIQEMRKKGIQIKAIILSAYSEFSYAKQAMKLGVSEYLLKPISVDEFSKALHAVEAQRKKEQAAQPDTLGTLEQVAAAILYGQLMPDLSVEEYLSGRYGILPGQKIVEICIYLGNEYKGRVQQAEREWGQMLKGREGLGYCLIRADYEQSLLVMVYRFGSLLELERSIQYWMLGKSASENWLGSVGWIEAEGISAIKKGFETLYSYMDWNLTLRQDVLIAYPKVQKVQTAVCVYPIELEDRMKAELCLGELEQVQKVAGEFHGYFTDGKIYTPEDIKECYVRFIWAIIHITNELDMLDYANLSQQRLLDHVMGAKLFKELEEALGELLEKVRLRADTEEEVAHLTVRRTKSMIHEFYQSGITLDEIASKLNVTPEYLSMQFHKEVGETYTSYLKNYRVNKAKELLIGTQMKQYEIALEVGYTDSKYFSKVFRECTGYSPTDYRKMYK